MPRGHPRAKCNPVHADEPDPRGRCLSYLRSVHPAGATQGGSSMLRRTLGAIGAAVIVLSLSTGAVLAGQPGAACGEYGATLKPPGSGSPGCRNDEGRYARRDGTASLD